MMLIKESRQDWGARWLVLRRIDVFFFRLQLQSESLARALFGSLWIILCGRAFQIMDFV